METKERVLAYRLATELDDEALSSVSGGKTGSNDWYPTFKITSSAISSTDFGFDVVGD